MTTRLGEAEAFDWCRRLALSHYENFPVGSLLVPRKVRRHVYSIYAFARLADDIADEGYDAGIDPQSRLEDLDAWERRFDACLEGRSEHPAFIALGATIKDLQLPDKLFRDLLSAFRQDVVKRRYGSFEDVLDYCRRSANPVGRLILLLWGWRDAERHALSDEICTALQLTNFWQDLSVDLDKDRIYLPQDEMQRFGVTEQMLFARRATPEIASLVEFQVARTRGMFARGRPLPEMVNGRLRYELRLTWCGGMRLLERIEQTGYNTIADRPQITRSDKFRLLWRALMNSS